MRYLSLIIILFAFFAQIKSYATEQIPDYFIYKGKQYALEYSPLYPYLKEANKWEWAGGKNGFWCTALARDYYATYEIVGNELRLKDVRNCSKSLLKEFLSTFAAKDSIFKFDWFTDSIVIAEGRYLYDDVHEYYSILHFEKGKLVKETRMSYKEYLSNRLKWHLKISSIELLRKLSENQYQADLEIIEHYLETQKGDKSEFLTKLKTKYEKKFGRPISDFELKIQRIRLGNEYSFEITRTLYGARVVDFSKIGTVTKLSMEEWLDIIRALSTCCLDKWELVAEQVGRYPSELGGMFYIYSSSKNRPYDEHYEFPIKSGQLPNVNEFEKVWEDIIAKIGKNSAKP
ncbi:MAG: hypothetical protein LBC87_11625 [Fibromonadaceae bacterium]|jgi:hypothetical protein|nr:hypothetical protein [Fibromonadaceae bacterium]